MVYSRYYSTTAARGKEVLPVELLVVMVLHPCNGSSATTGYTIYRLSGTTRDPQRKIVREKLRAREKGKHKHVIETRHRQRGKNALKRAY